MADIKVSGTSFIALVLLWYLGISGCQAMNKIQEGLGDPLCWGGWIAFIVLILVAVMLHPREED
jgi:hypothetical protein